MWKPLKGHNNDYTIACGDWNCVLNLELDARNYTGRDNRPRTRNKILELINAYELLDVWRDINPGKKDYTWRKFNTTKQSRLDYFLISENLMPQVKKVQITPSYRSDHAPVILELKTGGLLLHDKCGLGFYRLNTKRLKLKTWRR